MVDYTDLLGCKFKVHGRSKEEGFDCYGLAIEVLRRNGIRMKDAFYDSLDERKEVRDFLHAEIKNERLEKPERNCIIEFSVGGEPLHIGVYIGNGFFIHTTHDCNVRIERLDGYKKRIAGYYKVSNS